MTIEYRAAVLHGVGAPMTVEKVVASGLGPGDVLVRIKAAGLCHTDLEVITGSLRYPLPIVLGHEAAGIVEELGPAARGLAVGDHVVLNITDALIGQYEGGASVLLHYSTVLNQLWFSRDPVALDTLAIRELDRERRATGDWSFPPDLEIYTNAVLLQLGVNDPSQIQIVRVH